MRFTPCECRQAGWCERHQCEKTRLHYYLCRTSQKHFQQWEDGQGPGQREDRVRIRRLPLACCRHRGLEPIEYVECDLCGGRKRQMAVFACALFEECTETRYGTRTERALSMAVCLTCEKYEPADGEP